MRVLSGCGELARPITETRIYGNRLPRTQELHMTHHIGRSLDVCLGLARYLLLTQTTPVVRHTPSPTINTLQNHVALTMTRKPKFPMQMKQKLRNHCSPTSILSQSMDQDDRPPESK